MRVKAKKSRKAIELVALVAGGAESPRPCIIVDPKVVEELELRSFRSEVYVVEEASSITKAYVIPNAVKLELIDDKGYVLSAIAADLVVQEGLFEPMITDVTIDMLGIQVVSFSKGLWRHINDPEGIVRESVKK